MLYADRFSGHCDGPDPRHLMQGSGGCTWPTIPAYRYTVASGGATGIWEFLNTDGIVLEMDPVINGVVNCQWNGPINLVPVTYCILTKFWNRTTLLNTWSLTFQHLLCQQPVLIEWGLGIQRCNLDHTLSQFACPGQFPLGDSGPKPWLMQTEYNKLAPPTWPDP